MGNAIIVEPHFLPSLEYMAMCTRATHIKWEVKGYFEKQTYRNRCYVLTAQGPVRCTVPVAHRHGKIPLDEIPINHQIPWAQTLWRTFESAYRKAPYFDHYADELKPILLNPPQKLWDLLLPLLSFCLREAGITCPVSVTSAFQADVAPAIDLRNTISAKKSWSDRPFYQPEPYYQIFGRTFVPNLSVLDLLMTQGPAARTILLRSTRPVNK